MRVLILGHSPLFGQAGVLEALYLFLLAIQLFKVGLCRKFSLIESVLLAEKQLQASRPFE